MQRVSCYCCPWSLHSNSRYHIACHCFFSGSHTVLSGWQLSCPAHTVRVRLYLCSPSRVSPDLEFFKGYLSLSSHLSTVSWMREHLVYASGDTLVPLVLVVAAESFFTDSCVPGRERGHSHRPYGIGLLWMVMILIFSSCEFPVLCSLKHCHFLHWHVESNWSQVWPPRLPQSIDNAASIHPHLGEEKWLAPCCKIIPCLDALPPRTSRWDII